MPFLITTYLQSCTLFGPATSRNMPLSDQPPLLTALSDQLSAVTPLFQISYFLPYASFRSATSCRTPLSDQLPPAVRLFQISYLLPYFQISFLPSYGSSDQLPPAYASSRSITSGRTPLPEQLLAVKRLFPPLQPLMEVLSFLRTTLLLVKKFFKNCSAAHVIGMWCEVSRVKNIFQTSYCSVFCV